MNTINPADCDRTTVYTGECRNFQDTEWITFNSGRRRSPNARDGNTWLVDVAHGSFWMRDDQVRDLVRLVPARPVTRDDLPSNGDAYLALMEYGMVDRALDARDMDGVLDAVVEHLNANGGAPAGDGVEPWPEVQIGVLEYDCARLRRAHEIVEGERDKARDSLRSLRGAHSRLTRDYRHLSDRAEAAEARTAPAVTKAEIEKAIDETGVLSRRRSAEFVADAVWSLVSGSDPAVFVVRESHIHVIDDPEDSRDFSLADGQWRIQNPTDSDIDHAWDEVESDLRYLIAVRRAREAEAGQATDPVEVLAGQIESATREAIRQVCDDLADVAPSLDPLTVERAMEVTAVSRKVAAHILGQEANDGR